MLVIVLFVLVSSQEMKVIAVFVMKWIEGQPPLRIASSFYLNDFGFFQRMGIKEGALFMSREVTQRVTPGQNVSAKHKEFICHVRNDKDGLAITAVTDEEYPQYVAHNFIKEVYDMFIKEHSDNWKKITSDSNLTVGGLDALLEKYQKPENACNILKIQKDLDSTKDVLLKTVEQLLERGVKLEDVAEKSNDLSFQSKAFMKQAESMNSCCSIL